MKIDEKLIELIDFNGNLNKKQFEILNISPCVDWKQKIINQEINEHNINLLLLLCGDFTQDVQEKIVNNYKNILSYKKWQKEQLSPNQNLEDEDKEFLHIYCDGACSGNPGLAGSGLAIYSNKKNPVLLYGAFVEDGTNNIAELNALYQALLIAKQSGFKDTIYIFSDSKYAIDCISKWAFSWKANNWSKKGGEIKNLDLIIKSHELYLSLKSNLVLEYVKGHSGVEGNELADRMALNTIKEKNEEFSFYRYENIDDILKMKFS